MRLSKKNIDGAGGQQRPRPQKIWEKKKPPNLNVAGTRTKTMVKLPFTSPRAPGSMAQWLVTDEDCSPPGTGTAKGGIQVLLIHTREEHWDYTALLIALENCFYQSQMEESMREKLASEQKWESETQRAFLPISAAMHSEVTQVFPMPLQESLALHALIRQ